MRDDTRRLQDILEACELLIREVGPRVTDLRSDPVLQAATQRWIEIIGEAASRLSDQVRDANPDVPWRSMIGMRNVLAHGYFDIVLVALLLISGTLFTLFGMWFDQESNKELR